jgi:hypothetical protein
MEEKIIKLSNDIAKARFMDFPDYDSDNPIDNLADALTVIVSDVMPHDSDIDTGELYDFINNKLK